MTDIRTVFVTGASGFIGKHIVLRLLDDGYLVKGSVRSPAKAEEVRAAMAIHAADKSDLENRLQLVELDLLLDGGWQQALSGCNALLHTASPFPMNDPQNEDEVIRPAVEGTMRALKAARAAGIQRVVLTSSCAAIYYQNPMPDQLMVTEDDWTDLASPAANVYVRSKTLAERAAWNFAGENPGFELTTINPCMVLGPALDRHFGTSLAVVERIMKARDPAMPAVMIDVVDVRDIALMHVLALSRPESIGERLIGASGPIWFAEIGQVIKRAYPSRKVVTRQAPNLLIRLLARFDHTLRTITPMLGKEISANNAKAGRILGIEFIDPDAAILGSADFLLKNGFIR
ncbi:MAG: aldehyde reductase [Rhodobacteraceae bacterium]|nr:aldehyde reductase [Paracoccaceae bacterium]